MVSIAKDQYRFFGRILDDIKQPYVLCLLFVRVGQRPMWHGHLKARTLQHFTSKALLSGVEKSSVELGNLDIKEFR